MLKPLGIWGVFAIAAVDSAVLGMPIDAVVVGYVYNDRKRFVFFVVMAALGSALGSIPLYLIGYLGGEEVLRKRISAARLKASGAVATGTQRYSASVRTVAYKSSVSGSSSMISTTPDAAEPLVEGRTHVPAGLRISR